MFLRNVCIRKPNYNVLKYRKNIKYLHLYENLMLGAHKIDTVYHQNEQISVFVI